MLESTGSQSWLLSPPGGVWFQLQGCGSLAKLWTICFSSRFSSSLLCFASPSPTDAFSLYHIDEGQKRHMQLLQVRVRVRVCTFIWVICCRRDWCTTQRDGIMRKDDSMEILTRRLKVGEKRTMTQNPTKLVTKRRTKSTLWCCCFRSPLI